jgi:hydroxymethylglutaryl-CoA lyase
MRRDILISEVGPRDGLQSISRAMPTAAKVAWIRAMAAAGLAEIEVGSFVSPKLLPQMADAAEVVKGALGIGGFCVAALAPNLKGAVRAAEAGAQKISLPVSASRLHSQANINMTPEQAVAQVAAVVAYRDGLPEGSRPEIEAGISTAFGCTMEGQVSEAWVIELAEMLAKAGADAVNLADTTGMGNPAQVKRLFKALKAALGVKAGGAHLHNTRGQGLANVVAALDVGVTTFDSSLGGLGGCPYAPGATGNIVTEDLVFLLEGMGLRTGIDLDRLVAAREAVLAGLPGETLYGHLHAVGYPKGFQPVAAAASASGTAADSASGTAA